MMPPAQSMNYHPLVRAVSRGLKNRCGVSSSGCLLVAVSGGADSMALLHALNLLRGRRGWSLELWVGHVQHHLHDQAETHAQLVKQQATAMGLGLERRDVDVKTRLAQHGGNVEAVARRLRYDALREMAEQVQASAVVTAHHGDDQLETLLMRLMSGSGTRGMRGLRWHRKLARDTPLDLVRPMLATDRATVMDFVSQERLPYCTDPTNADTDRVRSRLRSQILPELRAMRPAAARAATQTADQIAQAHRAIRCAVKDVTWQGQKNGNALDRRTLRELPEAVGLEVLRHRCGEASLRLLGQVLRASRDRQGGERSFSVSNSCRIVVSASAVCVLRRD